MRRDSGANTTVPPLPEPLLAALRMAAGEDAAECYVVGGYLRDQLLGRAAADLDLAVASDPRALANALRRTVGGSVFPLSAERGVWRLTLAEPVAGISGIDLALLHGDLRSDLADRDFTVNAMAAPPEGGALIDPHGGAADLRAGVLRLVRDDAVQSDPLRALRAVRLVCELALTVEPESGAIIARDAPLLARAAGERQRDELARVFATDQASAGVRLMDRLGLLDIVLPELSAARGCLQPKEHFWDVLTHSVETVAVLDCLVAPAPAEPGCRARAALLWSRWPETARARLGESTGEGRTRGALLKLVGLLHDVSKAETRSVGEDGRMRFYGHPERGAERAAEALRRLRFNTREVELAALLIKDHLRPGQLAAPGEVPSSRALSRLARDLGDDLPMLLLLNLADGAAAAGPRQTAAQWAAHVRYTAWILAELSERPALAAPPRLVTGHDLITELGMSPGAALGQVLAAVSEAAALGEVTSRAEALALARRLSDGNGSNDAARTTPAK